MAHDAQHAKMSDRKFGLVFGVALALLAGILWLLFGVLSVELLIAAGFFAVAGISVPGLLLPVNRGWMAFAQVIGAINNRLILGTIFVLVITPLGLFMRLIGRDPMARRIEPDSASYLVPVGRQSDSETMRDIF